MPSSTSYAELRKTWGYCQFDLRESNRSPHESYTSTVGSVQLYKGLRTDHTATSTKSLLLNWLSAPPRD